MESNQIHCLGIYNKVFALLEGRMELCLTFCEGYKNVDSILVELLRMQSTFFGVFRMQSTFLWGLGMKDTFFGELKNEGCILCGA